MYLLPETCGILVTAFGFVLFSGVVINPRDLRRTGKTTAWGWWRMWSQSCALGRLEELVPFCAVWTCQGLSSLGRSSSSAEQGEVGGSTWPCSEPPCPGDWQQGNGDPEINGKWLGKDRAELINPAPSWGGRAQGLGTCWVLWFGQLNSSSWLS